jgi:uncharacterized protein (DUF1778 family)
MPKACRTYIIRGGAVGCIDNVGTTINIPPVQEFAMPPSTRRKDDVIQIRASAEAKAILNRAAALCGQKLSEFMLESARRQAEDTLLDQRIFFLDDAAHARFLALLDAPPKGSAKVRARLRRKPPWQP